MSNQRNDGLAWAYAFVAGSMFLISSAHGQTPQQPRPAQNAQPAQSAPGQRPACVSVTWTVRYGSESYNHWVTISNGCDALVRCTVRTNVNPAEASVELAPAQSRELNTFLGSPAREFTPTVNCTRGDGEPARVAGR